MLSQHGGMSAEAPIGVWLDSAIVPRNSNCTKLARLSTPDQAIPVALFVNESITNSAKYGYPNSKCEAWIEVVRIGSNISVSVRDKGVGLPSNFEWV